MILNNVFSMLVSVAVWSFYPVLSTFALTEISPVELVLFVYLCSLPAAIVISAPHLKQISLQLSEEANRNTVIIIVVNGAIWAALHYCLYTALTKAPSVPAIITYEVWPVILILLGPIFFGGRFKRLSSLQWALAAIAFVGVFIATVETPESLISGKIFSQFADSALLFAVAAAFLQAINTSVFAYVATCFRGLPVFPAAVASETLGRFFSVPVLIVLIYVVDGRPLVIGSLSLETILVIISIGVFVFALGSAFYTKALAESQDAVITVLWYFVPVLSVFFLAAFGLGNLTTLSIIGVGLVVAANLFLCTGSILPNATLGAIAILFISYYATYLTTPIGVPHVFEVLNFTGVFFAVLVTFLMDRFQQTAREKTRLTVDLNQFAVYLVDLSENKMGDTSVEALRKRCADLIKSINDFDYHTSRRYVKDQKFDINGKMSDIKNTIRKVRVISPETTVGEVERVVHELDRTVYAWINAKEFRMSYGEFLTLVILGSFTITISFLGRPETFYGDIFAVVIATSVCFVTFQVFQFNRGKPERSLQDWLLIQRGLKQLGYSYYLPEQMRRNVLISEKGEPVIFGNDEEPTYIAVEEGYSKIIAVLVLGAIAVVFTTLLLDKHSLV